MRHPESMAACFGAAQHEAERFFGQGPVRAWRAPVDWRPWLACAALVGCVGLAALLWPWVSAVPQERAPVPNADRRVATAALPAANVAPPAAMPQPAAEVAAPGCAALACAQPEPVASVAIPPQAAPLVLPADLEAWALDAPPLGAQAVDVALGAVSLVNTPEIPDEHDATPGDESTPEEWPAEPATD